MLLQIVMLEHRRRGREVVMIHFCYFYLEICQFVEGYLELDAISNELESVRLEAVYLAGASDYEKLSK